MINSLDLNVIIECLSHKKRHSLSQSLPILISFQGMWHDGVLPKTFIDRTPHDKGMYKKPPFLQN